MIPWMFILNPFERWKLYWLRARRRTTRDWMAAVRRQFDGLDRRIKLGAIPRTAAFSGLTGQDYSQLGDHFDYVFPKHYFWHRGFDGIYGSACRMPATP